MQYSVNLNLNTESKQGLTVKLILSRQIQLIIAVRHILDIPSKAFLKELFGVDIHSIRSWQSCFDLMHNKLSHSQNLRHKYAESTNFNLRMNDSYQNLSFEQSCLVRDQLINLDFNIENLFFLDKSIEKIRTYYGPRLDTVYKNCLQIVNLLILLNGEILPYLGQVLTRDLQINTEYLKINKLRDIVAWQEKNTPKQVYNASILYAFGHQYLYPDIMHKLFLADDKYDYLFRTDINTVSNSELLALQIKSGMKFEKVDVSNLESSDFRDWSLTLGMQYPSYVFDEPKENKLIFQIYEAESIANTIYFHDNELRDPIISPPEKFQIQDRSIKEMLGKSSKFILVQWRSNLFKSECTKFNQHRNSLESEIIKALDIFTREYKLHVFIACQVELDISKNIIITNPFIHTPVDFNEITHEEYLYLLANCFFFFSGPSGAYCSSGVMFHRPNLIFDWPSFFPISYHPYCWYICSDLFHYGQLVEDNRDNLIRLLPHNYFVLESNGYMVKPLNQIDLYKSLVVFSEVITNNYDFSRNIIYTTSLEDQINISRQKSKLDRPIIRGSKVISKKINKYIEKSSNPIRDL